MVALLKLVEPHGFFFSRGKKGRQITYFHLVQPQLSFVEKVELISALLWLDHAYYDLKTVWRMNWPSGIFHIPNFQWVFRVFFQRPSSDDSRKLCSKFSLVKPSGAAEWQVNKKRTKQFSWNGLLINNNVLEQILLDGATWNAPRKLYGTSSISGFKSCLDNIEGISFEKVAAIQG